MKQTTTTKLCSLIAGGILLTQIAGCDTGQSTSSDVVPAADQPTSAVQIAAVEVANPTEFRRSQEPLYFRLYDLGLAENDGRVSHLIAKTGDSLLPSQLIDRTGDGTPDTLLVAPDFDPAQKHNISLVIDPAAEQPALTKQTQAEISHKVGGEWQDRKYIGGSFQNVKTLTPPEQYTDHSEWIRYEGPGIESDKVGYRVYLDWRNGFDIFGKKVPEMVLQNVGQDGYQSYHEDADWGLDILKVGQSLGAGGYGFWNGEKVELVSDVTQWTANVVENGPLYSALKIDYQGWKINDQQLDLSAQLSMNAGSRLVHTRLTLSEKLPNIAIGMVKHPGTELIQSSQETSGYAWNYVASWGKQSLSGEDSYLGMAVIFRRSHRLMQTEDQNSYVSVMSTAGGEVEYYFLAAWDGEHNAQGITNREQFVAYLEREIKRLTVSPRIRLENQLSQQAKQFPVTAEAALNWSKRLADSELERKTLNYHSQGWDLNRRRVPNFEYDIIGLLPMAYDELSKITGEEKYAQVIHKVTSTFITDEGDILGYDIENYNIDAIKPGRAVLRLHQQTGEEKYRKAVDLLAKQLEQHPRTSEGAFWHKLSYPHQLWLDGVYMGMPFLAEYSVNFADGKHLKEVVKEFVIAREKLRDPNTGLYYHAWDESKQMVWADKDTGLSEFFWARGLGWLAMALVDTLDYIPESEAELRQPLLQMIEELGRDLAKVQDLETGTWFQIMDMPERVGNYRESSATAMFTYFYAKAIHKGYLSRDYQPIAVKAYEGMIKEFVTVHPDGLISMTNQCLVAGLGFGRDGSYDYYMSERVFENDPKGTGPFILAGVEMYKLLNEQ